MPARVESRGDAGMAHDLPESPTLG
jgi:hypothetical protein